MKEKGKTDSDTVLNDLIEKRLALQSVQRYLTANNIPVNKNFWNLPIFKEKYNSWPQYKRKSFLETIAGLYWKRMQKKIEG